MSFNSFLGSPDQPRQAIDSLRLRSALSQPAREPLRHILLGSPTGVRQTIYTLHVLNYVEQAQWSQLIRVPQTGIVITPEQGEVMSYLVRYRSHE